MAESSENSAGEEQTGSNTEAGAPNPEDRGKTAIAPRIDASVDIEDDDRAAEICFAFRKFGAANVASS